MISLKSRAGQEAGMLFFFFSNKVRLKDIQPLLLNGWKMSLNFLYKKRKIGE